jgi:hypothetical protein
MTEGRDPFAGLEDELEQVALGRAYNRLMPMLSGRERRKFMKLLERQDPEALTFIRRAIPAFDEILQQEREASKSEMASTHAAVMKKLGM